MKNLLKTIFICVLAFVIFLVVFIIRNTDDKEETEELGTIEIETETKEKEVFYSEGNEDSNYNYIVNADVLGEDCSDLPYNFFIKVGDKVNEYLQSNGYTKEQLTITDAYKKGTYVYVTMKIGDSNDKLFLTHEYGLDEWNMYIEN